MKVGPPPSQRATTCLNKTVLSMFASYLCRIGLLWYFWKTDSKINNWTKISNTYVFYSEMDWCLVSVCICSKIWHSLLSNNTYRYFSLYYSQQCFPFQNHNTITHIFQVNHLPRVDDSISWSWLWDQNIGTKNAMCMASSHARLTDCNAIVS